MVSKVQNKSSYISCSYPPYFNSLIHDLARIASRRNPDDYPKIYASAKSDLHRGIFQWQNGAQSKCRGISQRNDNQVNIRKWTFFPVLHRFVPVMDGVMTAPDSTVLFLKLINNLSNKIKNKVTFQIGSNQGAITSALARSARKVVAVDILGEAVDNTSLTIESEEPGIKGKVTLFKDDLSFLKRFTEETGIKCDYLFFNNPVFKGSGNPNSLCGNDFELPKRAIKLLPHILNQNGEGYFLACKTLVPNDKDTEKLWTVDRVKDFVDKEMTGWQVKELNHQIRGGKNWVYTVVKISFSQAFL